MSFIFATATIAMLTAIVYIAGIYVFNHFDFTAFLPRQGSESKPLLPLLPRRDDSRHAH